MVRKQQTAYLNTRLPAELKAELERFAKASRTPVSAIVRAAIANYLSTERKGQ